MVDRVGKLAQINNSLKGRSDWYEYFRDKRKKFTPAISYLI